MNLMELRQQVMFQTGNDAEDLGDFQPHLTDYINEGYDLLLMAHCGEHVDPDGAFPPLAQQKSEPELPGWMHRSLADYAAWMVYRNGSAQKQSRGFVMRKAFDEVLNRVRAEGGKTIRNIPR